MATPDSLPSSSGRTRPIALAAPVFVGMIDPVAERARLRSACLPSSIRWSLVKEWTVLIQPQSMPKLSCRTLAMGARQFVVHEPTEMTSCPGLRLSSFTPRTTVASAFSAGADTMTFFAPAARWTEAFSLLVNLPVHSSTMSTPSFPHS